MEKRNQKNVFDAFRKHIKTHFPHLKNNRLLLAVSGGVDSVVLAHLANQMQWDFALAHCNFNLRGVESDADEEFVKQLAKQLEVLVFTQQFDTRKLAKENGWSTQVAARKLRYAWFAELAQQNNYTVIVTAHHANDALETYLINSFRGTGIKGLTGIPQQTEWLARPLLGFSRDQIEAFAKSEAISWREDASNASDVYLRNSIRHHVVPTLEEHLPNLLKRFMRTQENLQATANLLDDYTSILFSKIVEKIRDDYYLDIQTLQETPNTQAVLYQLLAPFGFTEWNDVYQLLTAESGKQVLSKTHRLVRDRAVLILTKKQDQVDVELEWTASEAELSLPIGTLHQEKVSKIGDKKNEIAYLSADKIRFPLHVRRWKAGDRFKPLGMRGTKKLSDFLKDEKCTLTQKENTWVVCSGSKIAWVIGHRIHDDFKVTPNTKQLLKITLK